MDDLVVDRAIRRHKSQTTLLDVFCALEPGDKLEYSNGHGQTFTGVVLRLHGYNIVVVKREDWPSEECLIASRYWLERVL